MATATPVSAVPVVKKPGVATMKPTTAPAPGSAAQTQLEANAKTNQAKPAMPASGLAPKPATTTPTTSPTPVNPISNTNGLLAALQQMVANLSGVQTGQNSISNTQLQSQLGLTDLMNQLQTNQTKANTAISQNRLDLSNLGNQQQQQFLNTQADLSKTNYQNQLSDLMANMGFTQQQNAITNQQEQNQLGDIAQNKQYATQANDLNQQTLNANKAIAQRNEPIQERQMTGAEAASGSVASAGYGERLGNLKQSFQDQMDAYTRQQQQQDLTVNQQNTGFANQTRDVGLAQQQTGINQAQTAAGQQSQKTALGLSQQETLASEKYQKTTLENAAKSLGIDKKVLDQGTQQALDQLGISTMVSKEQIWQAFMDKQAGTYNALAPLLSAVQSVMGITPPNTDTTGQNSSPMSNSQRQVAGGTQPIGANSPPPGSSGRANHDQIVLGNPTLQTQFSMQVANGLGIAPQNQQSALQMLNAWMKAEGNSTSYNPLSTSLSTPTSTPYNNLPDGGHIWNYPDMTTGVKATIDTLTKSKPSYGYGPIVQALRSGDTNAFIRAIQASKWGSNASRVASILNGGK